MPDEISLNVTMASVKVMRSHDYCHFEVVLGSSSVGEEKFTDAQIDDLRKRAARLADKAVEQYKVARSNLVQCERDEDRLTNLKFSAKQIEAKSEVERTPDDKALLKTLGDIQHRKRSRYDYEDDWQEPHYDNDDDDTMF